MVLRSGKTGEDNELTAHCKNAAAWPNELFQSRYACSPESWRQWDQLLDDQEIENSTFCHWRTLEWSVVSRQFFDFFGIYQYDTVWPNKPIR